ncbi:MAG TPA: hypothetical protein VF796_15595 [Humisphaera sp.]
MTHQPNRGAVGVRVEPVDRRGIPLAYAVSDDPRSALVERVPRGAWLLLPAESLGSVLLTLATCGAGAFLAAVLGLMLWFSLRVLDRAASSGFWWCMVLLDLLMWAVVGVGMSSAVRGRWSGSPRRRRIYLSVDGSSALPMGDAGRVRRVSGVTTVLTGWLVPTYGVRVSVVTENGRAKQVTVLRCPSSAEAERVAAELRAAMGLAATVAPPVA